MRQVPECAPWTTLSGMAMVTVYPVPVLAPCDSHCGANEEFSLEASLCDPFGLDSNWYWKPAGPVGQRSTHTASSLHAMPPLMLLPPVMRSSPCCAATTGSFCCASKRTYKNLPSVATCTMVDSV